MQFSTQHTRMKDEMVKAGMYLTLVLLDEAERNLEEQKSSMKLVIDLG